MRRLSLDAFEALSARYPELGRAILFDLGRIPATRLRWLTERAAGMVAIPQRRRQSQPL